MRFVLILIVYLFTGLVNMFGEDLHPHEQYRNSIYQSYISGKIFHWGDIIEKMDTEYGLTNDPRLLKQIIFANYGYIGYQIGVGNDDEASRHLVKTMGYLDAILSEDKEHPAWVYTMYSATLGFKLSFNPMKAPFIGPSVISNIDKAIEADSLNPLGWMELGNSYFYRPAFFGGSASKALIYYQKSLNLFQHCELPVEHNWIFLNLHVQVAQCYIELKKYRQAMEVYEQVLQIEPGFSWVKEELKPALDVLIEGLSRR